MVELRYIFINKRDYLPAAYYSSVNFRKYSPRRIFTIRLAFVFRVKNFSFAERDVGAWLSFFPPLTDFLENPLLNAFLMGRNFHV